MDCHVEDQVRERGDTYVDRRAQLDKAGVAPCNKGDGQGQNRRNADHCSVLESLVSHLFVFGQYEQLDGQVDHAKRAQHDKKPVCDGNYVASECLNEF